MFGYRTHTFLDREDRDLVRGDFPYLTAFVLAFLTADILSTIAVLFHL